MQTSLKVIEQQPTEPRKSKRVRKIKELCSNKIDSQFISFYLVEGNRNKVTWTIPIVLQVEDDPKM